MSSDFKLDDKALNYFFKEMHPKYLKRAMYGALSAVGKEVIKGAKLNIKTTTKGFSNNNLNKLLKGFKIKKSRKEIAVYVGNEYYKARWLEKGTKERYSKTARKKGNNVKRFFKIKEKIYRGKIEPQQFLENAVKKVNTKEIITTKLKESIEKIIKNANKQKNK